MFISQEAAVHHWAALAIGPTLDVRWKRSVPHEDKLRGDLGRGPCLLRLYVWPC